MIEFKWETNLPKLPDDFSPLTQQWAAYMAESEAINFAEGGRPQTWPALKAGGASHLFAGGALLASQVQDFGPDFAEVRIGAGIPYAWIHQTGGVINHPGSTKFQAWQSGGEWIYRHGTKPHLILMPARPYAIFQREDIENITQTFSDYIFTFMENNREVNVYG